MIYSLCIWKLVPLDPFAHFARPTRVFESARCTVRVLSDEPSRWDTLERRAGGGPPSSAHAGSTRTLQGTSMRWCTLQGFQLRLLWTPENQISSQMVLRSEMTTLGVTKARDGFYDEVGPVRASHSGLGVLQWTVSVDRSL